MKMIKYFAFLFLITGTLGLISCSKQDDYKKFIEGGDIIYPGRVDSVIVQPGNRRIQLRVVLSSDPTINKVKTYWNNRGDSLELNVIRTGVSDTVNVLVDNLNEGVYNFEVYTYNKKGNSSVVKNASGSVYGESFQSTLSNRFIESLGMSADGNAAVINWGESAMGEIGIELKYKDGEGKDKLDTVPADRRVTELTSFKDGGELLYRSLFKPDSLAIDVFSLPHSTATLPVFERQLVKSNFKVFYLPTDLKDNHGWVMPNMWNDTYNAPGFATQNGSDIWFTFDTGVSLKLSRFKIWQASDRLYQGESIKKFEIWGSDAPNPDGTWESWTKLMTCQSVKPSGSPVGTNTAADLAYAAAGEEFILPAGANKTRYIRIKVLETYGNAPFATIGELTFWTNER